MDNAYKTMDNNFIESVWWVFAELNKKNLVYKDVRVSFYCPRCATPLSNSEIAVGENYKDVEDPAVTVKFKLKNEPNTYLLAWTTTPWTLPANVGLAVDPEMNYLRVKLKETGETYIFAESRKNEVLGDIVYPIEEDEEDMKVDFLGIIKGKRMLGWEYEPLYNFIEPDKKAHFVIGGDFVAADEGTGIVHIAAGFGEVDMEAAKENDLPVIITVDDEAKFLPEVTPWAGLYVKDADESIIEDLKNKKVLFKSGRHTHSYPHCWRCSTPLIYKAQPAWYVNVSEIRSKMIKTNNNINWYPEHMKKGRFGKALETSPDWNISRTRYWGAPIPVWECDKCGEREVIGSRDDLAKKADYFDKNMDLHRPHIDNVKIKCACGGLMNRVPEVFDCWFESGSMPYAQVHYPFENKEWLDKNFPADFIAEGQDQTRGWFNKLHVLGTALFNKNAFSNVIVNGIVLAQDGKKMSKSAKNYPDPWQMFDAYGVDAMRYYLFTSPVIEAENINFTEKDVAEIERKLVMLLWNVVQFYNLYTKDLDKIPKAKSDNILDKWILSELEKLIDEMTQNMDGYKIVQAGRPIIGFIDELSTWYVRRSRDRFKSTDQKEKDEAIATLHEVLVRLSLVIAPFTPFISEQVWQAVTGRIDDSVHLEKWPEARKKLIDNKLHEEMDMVREIVSYSLEARAAAGIPIRQVLASVTVKFKDKKLGVIIEKNDEYKKLIMDEINVEDVKIEDGLSKDEKETFEVSLDTKLTPDLKKKGKLREIVRHVNSMRKAAGLTIGDRVNIYYETKGEITKAVFEDLGEQLKSDTLADALKNEKVELEHMDEFGKDDDSVWIGIEKV
jgi:isoleucyl-tRNA synthetase